MRGTQPQAAETSKTHAEGRVCWCGSVLSIYNKGPACWAHTAMVPPLISVKGRSRNRLRCVDIEDNGHGLRFCHLEPEHKGDHEWV